MVWLTDRNYRFFKKIPPMSKRYKSYVLNEFMQKLFWDIYLKPSLNIKRLQAKIKN